MKRFGKRTASLLLSVSLLWSLCAPALAAGTVKFTGIDTLMIYNPLTAAGSTMTTGSMSGQVGSGPRRAPARAGEESGFYFVDQDVMLDELATLGTGRLPDTVFPGEEDQALPEFPQGTEELPPEPPEETSETSEEIPEAPEETPEPPEEPPEVPEETPEDTPETSEGTPEAPEETPEPPEEDLAVTPDPQATGSGYSVGSVKRFFAQPGSSYQAQYGYFNCLYAGSSCYIWGFNYADRAIANAMGRAFDNKIFQNDTNYYGTARYIRDGGKLNILIYPMSRSGLCGFFRPIELLTASELGSDAQYFNHDEAVIHVNASVCTSRYYESVGLVTLAHEYQHLICFSSTLLGYGRTNLDMMGVWLNEAMSMQAEEISYPGEVVRSGYIAGDYNNSGDIATGQSLYNFATENDIGVYGQVFMFSEYLKRQSGSDRIFKTIHDYWRTRTRTDLTDARLLYNVLPSVRDQIGGIASYPGLGLSAEESFLSKLNLAFQIAGVLKEDSGIYSLGSACGQAAPKVYTGTRASIEGGGRILVYTRDGESYTVPSDADARLIYVGFKDGKMVIPPTTAANYTPPSYKVAALVNDPALGSVSLRDNVITVTLATPLSVYDTPAYTVTSGKAEVSQNGNTFTVLPSGDCTVRINLMKLPDGLRVWDGTVADSLYQGRNENEYFIYTGAELAKVAQMVNSDTDRFEKKSIYLCADLDLGGHEWAPIGERSWFYGDFYGFDPTTGKSHTIYNMTIGSPNAPRSESWSGLFGRCDGVRIQGVTLRNVSIYTLGYGTGAVAGTVSKRDTYKEIDGEVKLVETVRSVVEGCTVTGVVSGKGDVGMICGHCEDTDVSRCTASGMVCGDSSIGGILGDGTFGATMAQCSFHGAVSGRNTVGGIAGGQGGSITDCYSVSDLTAEKYIGGLIGSSSQNQFTNCYWTGTIQYDTSSEKRPYVGGLVGLYWWNYESGDREPGEDETHHPSGDGCLYDSTTIQTDTGHQITRGAAASREQLKEQSTYGGWDFDKTWKIDSGLNDGYPCFQWQTEAVLAKAVLSGSEVLEVGDTMSLTVTVVPAGQTYTFFTSDPKVATVDQNGVVTGIDAGAAIIGVKTSEGLTGTMNLQVHQNQANIAGGFAGGSGTEEDPYRVSTASNLFHLANMVNSGIPFQGQYFRQTADIALHGSALNAWTPIGRNEQFPFSGTYDGMGFSITGLYMDQGIYQGLFGVLEKASVYSLSIDRSTFRGGLYAGAFAGASYTSSLTDLNTLSDVTVASGSDPASMTGGVVGYWNSLDSNLTVRMAYCSSAATVDSTATPNDWNTDTYAGGIVGYLQGSCSMFDRSVIMGCSSSGTVRGNDGDYCGGIVGNLSYALMRGCYHTGAVEGMNYVAGIAARCDYGQLEDVYNAGTVHGLLNSETGRSGLAAGIAAARYHGSPKIYRAYNCGRVSSDRHPSYAVGIVMGTLDEYARIENCYYLEGESYADDHGAAISPADLAGGAATMAGRGFDFTATWTSDPGENSGYPILRCFYPVWDGKIPVYNKAAGLPYAEAAFSAPDAILIGLRDGERNDRDIADADAGVGSAEVPSRFYSLRTSGETAVLTVQGEYLKDMSVGVHTLTARFGAGVEVDFQVEVQEALPDHLSLQVSDLRAEDGALRVSLTVSSPADGPDSATAVMACYQDLRGGQMRDAAMRSISLTPGRSGLELSLPYTRGQYFTFRIYLLDSRSRPLTEPLVLRPEQLRELLGG